MAFYGGAETLIAKLTNYLSSNDIEVAIATLSLAPEISEIFKGIKVITPNQHYAYELRSTGLLNALGTLKELLALRNLIKSNISGFDVLNVHNFPATWATFPNLWRKPIVWMCNEPPDLWNNQNPSLLLKIIMKLVFFFDRLIVNKGIDEICVSDEFNCNRVVERYNRHPNIMNYGIEYDLFSKSTGKNILKKYELDEHFVLLHVGVLSPQKNQLYSIKLVQNLKSEIPNIKLVLAGLGGNPYEKMLKEYILKNRLDNHVLFTGHLSKEEIADFYQTCDVAIFPTKSQGGWLSPFEALCAGKPIVVSPRMTASSIIERENIGVVTDDFTKAVLDIYKNPRRYYEMAECGRKWVKENLNWDSFCKKMVEIFYKYVPHELD